jgi:hypothetical protein
MLLSSASRLSRERRFWLWAKPLSLSSPAPPGDGPLEERPHLSAAAVPGPRSSAMRSASRPSAEASTTREGVEGGAVPAGSTGLLHMPLT